MFKEGNEELLKENEATKAFFEDPEFVKLWEELKENPDAMKDHIEDERLIKCMDSLLNDHGVVRFSQDPNKLVDEM